MLRYRNSPARSDRETRVSRTKAAGTGHDADMPSAAQLHADKENRKAVRRLPGILREIAEATDYETAVTIGRVKGGTIVYIPRHPSPTSWIAKLVGQEKAAAIGKALGTGFTGMNFLIPKGPYLADYRKAEIKRLSIEGVARMKIAETLGIHVRTVQMHRRKLRAEGIQLPSDGGPSKVKSKASADD